MNFTTEQNVDFIIIKVIEQQVPPLWLHYFLCLRAT